MKKRILIFLILTFDVLISLVIRFIQGPLFLLMLLFQDLILPILFFSLVCRLISNLTYERKKKYIFISITILMVPLVIGSVILHGEWTVWHLPFRIIWAVVCGGLICLHNIVFDNEKKQRLSKTLITIEAFILLAINAFSTYILSDLPKLNRVDGIEIILMLTTIILLCIFSYYLGRTFTKQNISIKLIMWLIGILASEFVTLYLLGTPHILPTSHINTMVLWIMATSIVFCFCIVGFAFSRRSERKKVIT